MNKTLFCKNLIAANIYTVNIISHNNNCPRSGAVKGDGREGNFVIRLSYDKR